MAHQHAIRAFLVPNKLKNAKGKYKAHTMRTQTIRIKDICKEIEEQTHSVKADTMEYHIALFLSETIRLLSMGNKIVTPLFSAQAVLHGSFEYSSEKFDPEKHHIGVSLTTSKELYTISKQWKAVIVDAEFRATEIFRIINVQTGKDTDLLIPRRVIKIRGVKIKLAGNDENVGLYFMSENGHGITKLTSRNMIENKNATLVLEVPDLKPGSYRIKLVTLYGGKGPMLNKLNTTLYEYALIVPEPVV